MRFSDIIGQTKIKERLLRSYEKQRIPHAQLFSGPEGCGALSLALAYAQYLNCDDKQNGEPCGKCPSCCQNEKFIHPDVHFIFPYVKVDKKVASANDVLPNWRSFLSQNTYFSADQWHDYLNVENKQSIIGVADANEIIRKLNYKAFESKFKIVIIYLPEKMEESAANKILKVLEEPFENTVFLLVSENPEQLLPTIISRLQRIQIPPIDQESMLTALRKKNAMLDNGQLQDIIKIANGNYIQALKLIDDEQSSSEYFLPFCQMFTYIIKRQVKDMRNWATQMADKKYGREKQKMFLEYTQKMVREIFISNLKQKELNYMTSREIAFIQPFANKINHKNIQEIMDELTLAENHITQNVSPKMVFFDLALRMTRYLAY